MSTRNTSRKGATFERAVVLDLQGHWGWPVVTRASASKGVADVIAINPDDVLLVECKTNGVCGVDQWNQLFDTAMSCGAIPVVAHQVDRRSNPGEHGIRYMRLTGRKTGRGHRQPWDQIHPTTKPAEVA